MEASEFWVQLLHMKGSAEEDARERVIDFTGFSFPFHRDGFNQMNFSKMPNFSKAVFEEDADFFRAKFHSSANFTNAIFEKSAVFGLAEFHGGADFFGATFRGITAMDKAEFWGEADFTDATFCTLTSFDEAKFHSLLMLNDAIFLERSTFKDASFEGQVEFRATGFSGHASFGGAVFSKPVEFAWTVFSDIADFSSARFQDADFLETQFLGDACMGAIFNGTTTFDRVIFQRDTLKIPQYLSYLSELSTVRITSFAGARVGRNGEVRFSQPREVQPIQCRAVDHVSFLNCDVTKFNFQDVEWGTYRGRNAVVEEALMAKSGFAQLTADQLRQTYARLGFAQVTADQVRQTYARLRRNLEKAMRHSEAGDFYVGEMEMRQKVLERLGWSGLLDRLLLRLFSVLSKYGESIARPLLIWTPIVVISFTALRVLLGETTSFGYGNPLSLGESFWRSVAAFFQLRSAEYITDIVERLISIPILACVVIALRRKLERKS